MFSKYATRARRLRQSRRQTMNMFAVLCICLVPIYPAFGLYMQSYTGAVVRGDVDNSTIISAYDAATGQVTLDAATPLSTPLAVPVAISETSPENINKPADKPLEDRKKILYITHTVKRGDTISSIAQKYDMSSATLRSVNDLPSDRLQINQKLFIPRINGVQYVVQKGDTYSTIAEKYGITDMNNIYIANDIKPGGTLPVGKTLLLPNPTKDPTKRVVADVKQPEIPAAPVATALKKTETKTTPQPVIKPVEVKKTAPLPDPAKITYGGYTLSLKVNKGCRNFAWGNCTCFVAKYKNVTWRGNAKDWLKNAKKQGIATGMEPKPGAIIVYHGPGFPPAYGHVGIVMEVNEDDMVIKDMNYRALNEVTTRRETFNNPAIIGYIYVD